MKKEQVAVFEELLKDENFKGKIQLAHLLWLNTSTPKFKVGDSFKVTNTSHRVMDEAVFKFNAEVAKVYSLKTDNEWYYELHMTVIKNGKTVETKEYMPESQLAKCSMGEGRITEIK